MTTIPSDVYQGAGGLSEEEKTDLVPATAGEVAKYFNVVPAQNKRLRGHDVSRRSIPGDPTNEDTRVLMAFVKALHNALFNGEWADPNTLELAPNGKIRVKDVYVKGNRAPDVNGGNAFYLIEMLSEAVKAKVAGFLKSGGGLSFDTNGELQVDFQDLTVDQLTPLCDPNGGIIVNDDSESEGYGKLKIDFASMDPAIMRAVVYAMTQDGGGLSVDENGQLYVDFDSMPMDKFMALMKSLHVPIWVGENGIGTNFYVDGTNGVDSNTDYREVTVGQQTVSQPRGQAADYAWKTIAFATQEICRNYNISNKTVYINVAGGTYTDAVTLPMQQRTTGYIIIQPKSQNDVVNIVRTVTGSGYAFSHTGGQWELKDLNIKLVVNPQTFTAGWAFVNILSSSDDTGSVTLTHCDLSFEDNTEGFLSGVYGHIGMRLISVSGGRVRIRNIVADDGQGNPDSTKYESSWSGTKGNADAIEWLFITNGGSLENLRAGSTAPRAFTYNVSGSFTTFCNVSQKGLYFNNGTGSNSAWSGSATGKRYAISTGGSASTGSADATALASYFPGDSAGSIDSGTYSWIV